MKKKQFKMLKHLEKYRDLISDTGGNSIEELMNDQESNLQNNIVRTVLIISVSAQVRLLNTLYVKGLLK